VTALVVEEAVEEGNTIRFGATAASQISQIWSIDFARCRLLMFIGLSKCSLDLGQCAGTPFARSCFKARAIAATPRGELRNWAELAADGIPPARLLGGAAFGADYFKMSKNDRGSLGAR
jgi:hypothetical protein